MEGNKIKFSDGKIHVPVDPIIPFIEGDGIGVDIWSASKLVFDQAVEKAYSGQRKIIWKEVLAGEKAYNKTGNWLPQETLDTFQEYLVGIKGPLTTPVGGGITSLNVALRQKLDLFAICLLSYKCSKNILHAYPHCPMRGRCHFNCKTNCETNRAY